jgi:hypothetical protein
MYYVIFNPGYRDAEIMTNMNGFADDFSTYEDAKSEAEECLDGKDYRSFMIVGECTDDRNHII